MQIVKSDYDLKYILKGGLVRSSASGNLKVMTTLLLFAYLLQISMTLSMKRLALLMK